MRCFYEVLGVSQDAEEAELKRAYRKLALEWHPDKNAHRADEARDRFQEIQTAWDVLSSPQERAWYNSHRETILRAGGLAAAAASDDGGHDCPYPEHDLDSYCGTSVFKGFEGEGGFFAVYDSLFRQLAEEELQAFKRQKPLDKKLKQPAAAPAFGAADAADDDVRAFYAHWRNFQTVKDFAWLDAYNPSTAPGRQIRRLMEQENDKARRAGKKDFVEQVRSVAEHAQQLDPRVVEMQERAQAQKVARQAEAEQRRLADQEAKAAAAVAYQDADWIRAGEEEELAKLDVEQAAAGPSEVHECVVCNKTYKTEKALRNHEASKKHKDAFKKFKSTLRKEDELALDALDLNG